MPSVRIAPDVLDRILALQVLVAWAGETPDGASRLNWWRTDMVDEGAGGYLLAELMPRTHRWASLEASLRAAIQADQQKRLDMAQPDAVRTLFFWGFGIDEQLADRLREYKLRQANPDDVLYLSMNVRETFSKDDFEAAVQLDPVPTYKVVPSGRQMTEPMPGGHDLCATKLAAALLPLADSYPMPFYPLEG
jgi:hypothetical protein